MILWDEELAPELPTINALTPQRRYAVAVHAIEGTLASFDPPPARGRALELLRACLDGARAAVGGAHVGLAMPEGAEEEITDLVSVDGDAEPGLGPLLMAVANCYEIPEPGMATEHLFTLLSDCYSAVVERDGRDEETPAQERSNPSLTAEIALQKRLLIQAATP
ncbi:MAG TPA: hypothetical protein VFU35_09895 [Jatrophihabitans sp.]|nr:hypothetical protein [Jatrophihabitans sp.]